MSCGSNTQEGHYVERSCAEFLSAPLQVFQIEVLLHKADSVCLQKNSMHGALITRPKLFSYAGVHGTFSTAFDQASD